MRILLFTLMLFGCGSEATKSAPEPEDNNSPGPYQLTYSDVMEFTRGVPGSYPVTGAFKDDGNSRITIDGLPEGALFDAGLLSWNPPCTLSPENGQFSRGYQVYRVRINMEDSRSDNIVQKPAIILVHLTGEGSTCED